MTDTVKAAGPEAPFGLRLYRLATELAGPFAPTILKRRLKIGKEDEARLAERMGVAGLPRPEGALAWIHGASVGESLSVLPVVERLRATRPDMRFLVTTGTVTSAQLMKERLPEGAFHQFAPLDRPRYVEAFLDHWRPDAAIFIESEFWPNLLLGTKARGTPAALINGRISPKSFEKWRKRPRSAEKLLSAFSVIVAQDGKNAERLRELGGRDVMSFGNLKLAAPPLPVDQEMLDGLRKMTGDRPLWLAASSHPGEEEVIALAHLRMRRERPDLLTIIVPRHPNRGAEVAEILRGHGIACARRSLGESIGPHTQAYIGDTLGELGLFYRLSDIVLVGGSIVAKGGHNPLEPARLHAAILHGPFIYNFVETYAELRGAGGAALVRNELDLDASMRRLFADDKTRTTMAAAAMKSAEARADLVLNDVIAALEPVLPARRATETDHATA